MPTPRPTEDRTYRRQRRPFRIGLVGMALAFLAATLSCQAKLKTRTSAIQRGPGSPADPGKPGDPAFVIDAEVVGTVWLSDGAKGAALQGGGKAPSVAAGVKVEVVKLSEGAEKARLLSVATTSGQGQFRHVIKGLSVNDVLMVAAYKDAKSIGQRLVLLRPYLALAEGNVVVKADINAAISVASSILIRKKIDFATVTTSQWDALVTTVQDRMARMGDEELAAGDGAVADKLMTDDSFIKALEDIFNRKLEDRDKAQQEGWDFGSGRQALSEIFPDDLTELLAGVSPIAQDANAPPIVLSPSLLGGRPLSFKGKGVRPPVTDIMVSITPKRPGSEGMTSCLVTATDSFDPSCPRPVAANVLEDGTWQVDFDASGLVDGVTYTVTFDAALADGSSIAQDSFTFLWKAKAPSAAFTWDDGYPGYARATLLNIRLNDARDVAHYRTGNGPSCAASPWKPYTGTITHELPVPDGAKILCLQVKDAFGNASAQVSQTLTLDRSPPLVLAGIPALLSPDSSPGTQTELTDIASDAVSGLARIQLTLRDQANGMTLNASKTAFAPGVTAHEVLDGLGWRIWVADAAMVDGHAYELTVTAVDKAGNVSAPATGTFVWDAGLPPAPGGGGVLGFANIGIASLDVTWARATDAVSPQDTLTYTVYRSATDDIDSVAAAQAHGVIVGSGTDIGDVTVTGLSPGVTYYFNVIVSDREGNATTYVTGSQATASDTTIPVPGNAGLITSANPTATSLDLSWAKAVDNVTPQSALSYTVYRSLANDITTVTDAESRGIVSGSGTDFTSLTINGLAPGTSYHFMVVVMDAAGNKAAYVSSAHATASDATPPVAGNAGTITTASVADTSLTLNWTKATDDTTAQAALTYAVYRSSANNINTVPNAEANGLLLGSGTDIATLAVTGLTPLTTYYFTVVVSDAAGNKAPYATKSQTTAADTTKPVPGNGGLITTSAVTDTSLTLNWTRATDNVTAPAGIAYGIYRSNANDLDTVANAEANGLLVGSGLNLASFAVTGLTPATTYHFTVIAADAAGNKAIYASNSQLTAPDTTSPAPGNSGTISTSGITETGATISWTKATDNASPQSALTYALYRSSANNIGTYSLAEANGVLAGSGTDIASLGMTGLSPVTTYYVNVVVADAAGNKSAYATKSLTTAADMTPPAPGNAGTITTTAVTDMSLTLNWTKATDNVTAPAALSYAVYRSLANDMTTPGDAESHGVLMGSGTDIETLGVTGLIPSTTYYFTVVVQDAAGNKNVYATKAQTTGLDNTAPTPGGAGALTATNATDTSVTLSWTKATDNVSTPANLVYTVYRSNANDMGNVVDAEAHGTAAGSGTDIAGLVVTGLSPLTTYYVTVLVEDEAGNKEVYATRSQATAPAPPTSLGATPGNASVALSWSASPGALTYVVKRSTTSGTGYTILNGSVAGTGFTDATAVNGTTYYYVVAAQNADGTSAHGAEASATPLAKPGAFAVVSATPGDGSAVLTWNGATNATSYTVRRGTVSGMHTTTVSTTATSPFTDVGLSNGTTYYYMVTAVGIGGSTDATAEASVTPAAVPPAPTGVAAAPADQANTISWSPVGGATSYNLYWSTTSPASTSSTKVASVTSPFTHSGLSSGVTYYYVVTALNAAGESLASAQVSATPVAPSVTDVSATNANGR